ncbi:AAA family ATPase [Trinickia caryophylli]|uniref:Predicted ATPase n=1 Tax=Trinickia caryophylli TaxID=28094 RepID=A0A1X7CYP9_TRICW|nr:AAA family ATPase [Trinickia caryophylli]PMS13499.1 ATP-binding protein [Trinickia caryophylli]TRX11217.1 AAA family ATPase [Trinickia caryophylli]TRX13642.1 AAA family ATPase [Trinickia caryophylli]WQE15222.1 AAA family ATPase [Trinickia caryophylli]SMF05539.1 Predicted ATPase [Trinickia caryophylli]
MLTALAIANYRSLRELIVPLGALNIVTGPNGSGKSNLYRALRLLALTAKGGVIPSLAREGGLHSTLWAGPDRFSRAVRAGEQPAQPTVRKDPVSLRLGFASDAFGYAIDLGLPQPSSSQFLLDPIIKRECIWNGPLLRPSALLVDRQGATIRTRVEHGEWWTVAQPVASFDSMLTEFADPKSAPEMIAVREQIRSWRFYDHFRTDADAPARQPQIGTHTPVLADDGADLAAALQTIREIGDGNALDAAVDDAFPGARVTVTSHEGRFELVMHQDGLLRPLKAGELSDGTLRYLLLVAALLSPRPPALLVLNEPETSLHPDLLAALARLVAAASRHSQVLVVSHAARLVAALEREAESRSIVLEKVLGATQIVDADALDLPPWKWPAR